LGLDFCLWKFVVIGAAKEATVYDVSVNKYQSNEKKCGHQLSKYWMQAWADVAGAATVVVVVVVIVVVIVLDWTLAFVFTS
jgi:hypothetical protein